MKGKFCVSDLRKERENCPFDQEEITILLDGGKHTTELRRKLEHYFFNDPDFKDPINPDFMSHKDRYNNELRKAVALLSKLRDDDKLKQLASGMEGMRMFIGSGLGPALMKDGNPLALHFVMFLPTILGQCNPEQQAYWLTKAWCGEFIGTYAQTELGHGTFLRGLETTSTYDENTEEFVLNSPTITAYKWWPGGLGKTANCAVVMAQLYTKGECHGPHPFIVQLRDELTHKSLPGVNLGEIGPRLGMNTADNGFLGFKNHKIPRENMLMQHSQVLKDGTYVKPQNEKLVYGTMIFVRVVICFDVFRHLQRAVTIATRYSAVRHQSEMLPGEPEPQILDYQTQQYKIFPHIASVFAMTFAARYLWDAYNECTGNIQMGNLDLLPELHALSCGLKAQSTTDSADSINILRLACGGHGYMASSNFPRIWGFATAAVTYEGENTVLWLQVARYIIKTVNQSAFSSDSSLRYLKNHDESSVLPESDISNEGLLKMWQRSASFLIRNTNNRLQNLCRNGMIYERAWNACSIDLVKCAQVHLRFFTCERYVRNVNDLPELSTSTRTLLQKLCRLYLLYQFLLNQGDFLKCAATSPSVLPSLEKEMYDLLSYIRPLAVSIVDAFDIDDRILDSTLGAWDGNVYERLFNEALKNPLNETDVSEGYHKYLKPFMQSKL